MGEYYAAGGGGDDLRVVRRSGGEVVSALLALPVLVFSMVRPLQFDDWQWAALALASPVVVWGACPFVWSLWALFVGDAGLTGATMDVSLLPRRGGGENEIYLEVASAVTVFVLAGRYLEARAKAASGAALRAMLDLGAKDVAVIREGPGGRREVRVAVDSSMLTGESVPVEVGPGVEVTGATVNAGGRVVVRATRVGADTQLAQLGRLVQEAQNGKADVQRLASVVVRRSVVAVGACVARRRGRRGRGR